MEINYRDLLVKYIKHVKLFSGNTYLESERVELNKAILSNEFLELKQMEQE